MRATWSTATTSLALALSGACLALACVQPAEAARVYAQTDQRSCLERGGTTERDAAACRRSEARAAAKGRSKQRVDKEAIGRDPFSSLGGQSPFCKRVVGGRGGSNCKRSGSLIRPYPIGNYQYDIHINTGPTRFKGNLAMAIQQVTSFIWLGFLYLVSGVLLLLEWAFSLDPLGDSLGDIKRSLAVLHGQVFGRSWFMLAISVAGLWGIYQGLVRRRTIETVSGLASTLAMMVVALVLIANPQGTVGYAGKLVNDTSVAILSSASSGTFKEDPRGFADALSGVFDQIALRPYCALQFGDVDFCFRKAPSDVPDEFKDDARKSASIADLWLRFPAGSDERNELYEHWKQDGNKHQPYVRMQKEGSTGSRIALTVVIAIGLIGACALLAWIGVRILAQGVIALVLVLLTPVMLFAPAFGASGRAAFAGWGKRLIEAVVKKAYYALMLAVVLVVAGLVSQMQTLGWLGAWVLQITFWWGLFFNRGQVLEFMAFGRPQTESGEGGGVIRKLRNAAWTAVGVGAAAGAAKAFVGERINRRRAAHLESKETKRAGIQTAARDKLAPHAEGALKARIDDARIAIQKDEAISDELRHANRFLGPFDREAILARQKGEPPPQPSENQAAMLARRRQLESDRDAPEIVRQAKTIAARADRNLATQGKEVADRDLRQEIARRRDDVGRFNPAPSETEQRWAGVNPDAYKRADPEKRRQMERQVHEAIQRDRAKLHVQPREDGSQPSRDEFREAKRDLGKDRKPLVRAEKQTRKRERRERQLRKHLYRKS